MAKFRRTRPDQVVDGDPNSPTPMVLNRTGPQVEIIKDGVALGGRIPDLVSAGHMTTAERNQLNSGLEALHRALNLANGLTQDPA